TGYQHGQYALTAFEQRWSESRLVFTISQASGQPDLIPPQRRYELIFHGLAEPEQVAVALNGQPGAPASSAYDPLAETLTVTLAAVKPTDVLRLELSTTQPSLRAQRDRREETFHARLRAFRLDSRVKERLHRDLPGLLAGTLTLSRYELSDAQVSAL